jgi:hypothetical protein
MNFYNEELKPGDHLTFTDEMEEFLDYLGVGHCFEYGDDLIVLAVEHARQYQVLVTNPLDLTWQAWIYLSVAEAAQEFWLESQQLRHEGEGVSSQLPLAYWSLRFRQMTPNERQKAWEATQENNFDLLWMILTESQNKPFTQ